MDDVVIAKYLFPTDPIVDFIYRNAFGAKLYATAYRP